MTLFADNTPPFLPPAQIVGVPVLPSILQHHALIHNVDAVCAPSIVDSLCALVEHLATHFNLPQPSGGIDPS